jgi:hypothetical protein
MRKLLVFAALLAALVIAQPAQAQNLDYANQSATSVRVSVNQHYRALYGQRSWSTTVNCDRFIAWNHVRCSYRGRYEGMGGWVRRVAGEVDVVNGMFFPGAYSIRTFDAQGRFRWVEFWN